MKRKKRFLLSLISLISIFAYGQIKELPLDNEAFLLGTLSDYMGRRVSQDEEDKIDNYGYFNQSLVKKLNSLFIEKYDDLKEIKAESKDSLYVNITLSSMKLAEKINSNFIFKVGGWTQKKDTIFYGKLKENIFESELQKISFITGAYSRFGETKNKTYCIRLLNSLSKFTECKKILKELNCREVKTEVIKNIPTTQLIYFKPNKKVKPYLKNYKYLRDPFIKWRDERHKESPTQQ